MFSAFDFNAVASTVLEYLGQALLFGTIVALLTWALLATVLRRMRPSIQVAFWLVVLVKFVIPVGPGWQYSLSSLLGAVAPMTPAPIQAVEQGPLPAPSASTSDVEWLPVTAPLDANTASSRSTLSWWSALVGAYATLALLAAVWRVVAYRRFVRVTRSLPLADDATLEIVAAVARRVGVTAPVARVSDEAPAPFVFGLFRSTLVLSRRQLEDAAELEAVILHELAHVRRGDLWVRVLQSIVGAVLFFWPIVGWVNRRIDLARESACDEWALRHGSLTPGQYARLLLRCTRSRQSRWTYRPAAMASNLAHVERRIEMIMDSPTQRRSRMLGFLAGATLVGWAGFALSGASAAALQDNPPANTEPAMVIVRQAGDDAAQPPDVLFAPDAAADGQVQFFQADADNGHAFAIALDSNDKPEALAGFLADHPNADANGDGTLTRVERDAYATAMAMTNPAAVLAKYPKADRNGNGALEADEAARLVALGMLPDIAELKKSMGNLPHRMVMRTNGDNANLPPEVVEKIAEIKAKAASGDADASENVIMTQDGDSKTVKVMRVAPGDGPVVVHGDNADGNFKVRVNSDAVDTAGGDGVFVTDAGQKFNIRTAAPLLAGLGGAPSAWIIDNIEADPTSAEVNRYVGLVEAAPLAHFLELNPEADANHDGVLTADEREAFVERHSSKMRERVLEKHPEADTNGDGLLTNQEMHDYFRSNMKGDAWMQKLGGNVSGAHIMMLGNDGSVQVESETKIDNADDK